MEAKNGVHRFGQNGYITSSYLYNYKADTINTQRESELKWKRKQQAKQQHHKPPPLEKVEAAHTPHHIYSGDLLFFSTKPTRLHDFLLPLFLAAAFYAYFYH